jgi:2,4-dienoyl-CoA reductase-like NADH-dependent reductase (Old Yellow Enzyme family)
MTMWRPAERIRHDASGGVWPTAEQAAGARLFSPVRLGALELAQRTWVPAMVPWRATDDGHASPNVLAWYERFAAGQPGALVVEATGIRDVPSGPLLRIGDDRFIPGLRALADGVRRSSGGATRLFIQLIDFLSIRRRPERGRYLGEFLRITADHRRKLGLDDCPDGAVRERLAALDDAALARILTDRELESLRMGARERVTDVEDPRIADLPARLPALFASAARRAELAGFDGVELHYAHAYTMASFLSARNTRGDGYGGDLQNRLRLPLEVFAAVRESVRPGFAVGCRFLADECIEGGNDERTAQDIAVRFAAAGFDFLSLSRGGKFEDAAQPKVGEAAYPYTGRSGYECMPSYYSDARGPFGRNLRPAALVRSAVRAAGHGTPVVAAGGIHNFAQAESVLALGQADIVGFARQALADPDWFRKVRAGRGSEVRLCLYTNYCEALDQRHREVTCELWDREALDEPGIAKSRDGRRRLLPPGYTP